MVKKRIDGERKFFHDMEVELEETRSEDLGYEVDYSHERKRDPKRPYFPRYDSSNGCENI